MTQMELEARSQIAMQEIERRLSEYDGLIKERDELREALAEAQSIIHNHVCKAFDFPEGGHAEECLDVLKALATKKETR